MNGLMFKRNTKRAGKENNLKEVGGEESDWGLRVSGRGQTVRSPLKRKNQCSRVEMVDLSCQWVT